MNLPTQTKGEEFFMKGILVLLVVGSICALPQLAAAQSAAPQSEDHAEVGIFADYMRFSPVTPVINFVGLGGRAAFNVSPNVQIEGEMNYDFQRNTITTFNNGISSSLVTTHLRPLTGLFGPKFQAGTSGPFRVFVTGKVGFINFSTSTAGASGSSFVNSVNGVGGSGTHVAFYPGGGIEGFWGPIGVRAEVGDEIYLNNGTFNNLRVSFGPQFRF
jgi:hypothetical protein